MKCDGKVSKIERSKIPSVNVLTFECQDGRKVEMMVHDELLNFFEGEQGIFEISENLPEYKDGKDLCGIGMFYKDEGERKFFSIGGFLVVLHGDKNESFEYGKKYYICLKHIV
ncbi:hypothetical protein EYM_06920 [Ignicoccus islandicus DSM 13165]|uniref:DNA-directed RNA polymerase subunit Rpo8 n=1 Tax=Ignicoccus islandicus DSM 13165 TaxID=940295 RepID=A0A0U2VFG1_9CREN|nr:DNA-directed RNA polymerase subunit G [Ignicoccus islandicus]ALU12738.1 hypothetical protein EYM_06920 [Ignicoccus islandicus DSM 13165]